MLSYLVLFVWASLSAPADQSSLEDLQDQVEDLQGDDQEEDLEDHVLIDLDQPVHVPTELKSPGHRKNM